MHDLSLLNKELVAGGFYRRPTGRLLAELGMHLALSFGGTALFILSGSAAVKVAAALVMTLGNLGISTHTHTSSHNATSDRLWVNKALTFFGYPLMVGMSAMHWLNKHVTVHHPTPNVIGLDDDVDLLPWFALTEEQFQAGGPLRRFWHRHQWIAAGPAIAFNGFNLLFTSWGFLFRALRDRDRRTRMHWIDLGVICAHLALWIALPMLLFPPLAVLGFYGLRTGLMGYAMFAAFAPAHFPVEARFLPADGHTDRYAYRRRSDYMLLQTATTVNFRTGWYGRMLCSGVDHQIEHHLFPGISHVHYPKVSRVVQRFCHERGYPYRTLGWGEAIWKSLLAFKHPKRVEPALEALRERVNRGADEPALAGAALA